MNGTLLKGNKHAYIIVDYNMEEDNTLENEYTRIVMTIRDVFKNSILPSSDRWYLETQSLELAYVPVFLVCSRRQCTRFRSINFWIQKNPK